MKNDSTVLYAAIHFVSASSDHYNFLVTGDSVEDLANAAVESCGEDIAYIDQIFADCSDPSLDEELYKVLFNLHREAADMDDED